MPIEIKELHIKATVTDKSPSNSDTPSTGGEVNKDELVQICVDKVLEILKEKAGR